jgi:hypothetical protein
MLCDSTIVGMRMENDDVVILDRFRVAGSMNRSLVVRVVIGWDSSWDEKSGYIRKEGTERQEGDHFNHCFLV